MWAAAVYPMNHTTLAAECSLRFCGTRGSADWTTWPSHTFTPTMGSALIHPSQFRPGSFWTSGVSTIERQGRSSRSRSEEGRVIHSRLCEIALKRKITIRTFPGLSQDVQVGEVRIRLLHPTLGFLGSKLKDDLNQVSLVLDITYGIYLLGT